MFACDWFKELFDILERHALTAEGLEEHCGANILM